VTTVPAPCVDGHAHYWMVPTPDGAKALSTCKWCDQQRMFFNSVILDWGFAAARKGKVPKTGARVKESE
jgi:hypothetical protein